jgi:hypothetical protein
MSLCILGVVSKSAGPHLFNGDPLNWSGCQGTVMFPSCSPPAAQRYFLRRGKLDMIEEGDAHLPIMTLEAFITAEALSATFKPSSSTASFVIDDVKVMP